MLVPELNTRIFAGFDDGVTDQFRYARSDRCKQTGSSFLLTAAEKNPADPALQPRRQLLRLSGEPERNTISTPNRIRDEQDVPSQARLFPVGIGRAISATVNPCDHFVHGVVHELLAQARQYVWLRIFECGLHCRRNRKLAPGPSLS